MPHLLPTQIQTSHLRLRAPQPIDAHAVFQSYTQDLDVCRFMVWTPHTSETATEAYIDSCIRAWAAGNPMPYIIEELSTHRAIGMIEARIGATSVDIGYVLAKQYWGKNLMPEAISALTTEK